MRVSTHSIIPKLLMIVVFGVVLTGGSLYVVWMLYGKNMLMQHAQERTEGITQSIVKISTPLIAQRDVPALELLFHDYALQQNILFIAAYDDTRKRLTFVANDVGAWNRYTRDIYASEDMIIRESLVLPEAEASAAGPPLPYGRITVGYSVQHILATQRQFLLVALLVLLMAIVVGGITVYLLARSWQERLNHLIEASWRIARGEPADPVEDRRQDEIGRLGEAFESMRQALTRRETELQQLNTNLKSQVRERTFEMQMQMDKAEVSSQTAHSQLSTIVQQMLPVLGSIVSKSDSILESKQEDFEVVFSTVDEIKQHARNIRTIVTSVERISSLEGGEEEQDAS